MREKEQAVKKKIGNPLLKTVDCIRIPVTDYHKAAVWYEEYLGLTRKDPEGNVMILGDGMWMFLGNSEGQISHFINVNGLERESFTFETEDIATLHQSLTSSGTYVEPIVDHGGCGLQFSFKDPDGNRFHIWQDPNKTSKKNG
ncbi:VOC family protein [Paenibacillus tarimensis]